MKPNELTLAIEKMTRVLEGWEAKETDPNQLAAALRLVIEAAKRPTALSGEERGVLQRFLDRLRRKPFSEQIEEIPAIEAALSLASPFTREQLELIQAACDECRPRYEEGYTPILATLDAMLEDK